jgi:antitoxin VapB
MTGQMAHTSARRAKVFQNGRSRAVRIPKEFEFEGDEVIIRKENDGRLSLEPVRVKRSPKSLVEWLRSQPPLDEDFPEISDPPPEPVDLDLPQ